MDTGVMIADLITRLTMLGMQYAQAQQAGDQATLDAIEAKTVAMSNALSPPGGETPVVVG